MKTSNKLLFSFAGLIVLLMFLSDAVIWANYKRGKSGDEALTDEGNNKVNKIPVNTFKVLKIEGTGSFNQSVVRTEKYEISFWGEKNQQYQYSNQNDTLFIKLREGDQFSLGCPALETVILSEHGGISLQGFELPALNIFADKFCNIELIDMKVNVLDVRGKEENEFTAMGANSQIDSVNLQLGKSSTLKSYDVSYGHMSISVDSLRELQLDAKALLSMKQIK